MVQREPGLFAAWAGAAQVADWPAQELLSTRWTRDQALRRGHAMALADLEKLGMPVDGQYPGGAAGLTRQRRWLGNFGGVSAEPSFALRWMLSILAAPAYPLGDKLRYARAMEGSMERLWPALGLTRLAADCRELAVPVHVFQGRQDRITDPGLVRDWLAVLKAPSIRLVEAESAGHLCLYEQAAAYREFLRGLAP
jgi:pimeloyl-ACP methyl ester carboxylesterase